MVRFWVELVEILFSWWQQMIKQMNERDILCKTKGETLPTL